jgi:hypothetical protein
MSHFTVMVTGPDIADQLQPFHKFECTGIKDQYVTQPPAKAGGFVPGATTPSYRGASETPAMQARFPINTGGQITFGYSPCKSAGFTGETHRGLSRLLKTSTTGMDLMRIVINVVAKSSSRKSASHAALSLRRLKATVSRGEPL